MSKLIGSLLIAALVYAGLIVSTLAAQPAIQISKAVGIRSIPTDLVDKASRGNIAEIIAGLSESKIPAGVVFTFGDDRSAAPAERTASKPEAGTSTLERAMAAFAVARPEYRVEDAGRNGVLIAPMASACMPSLRQRLPLVAIRGQVFEAVFQLARLIDPTLPNVPPGLVGDSRKGRASVARSHVEIHLRNVTIKDAFAELAEQAPGLVWGIRESTYAGAPYCEITYYTENGPVRTSYHLRTGGL